MKAMLHAIRDDETVALALGIDVVRNKILIFALGGGFAAFAGALAVFYFRFVGAGSFTLETMILLWAMVFVGGSCSIWARSSGRRFSSCSPNFSLHRRYRRRRRDHSGGALRPPSRAPHALPPARAGGTGQRMSALLEVDGISFSFGGLRAVAGVTFTAEERAITSLIGPNGAGKTTVFNLISHFLTPQGGAIRLRGEAIETLPALAIARRSVGRTFKTRAFSPRRASWRTSPSACASAASALGRLVRGPKVNAERRAVRERAEAMLEAVGLIGRAKDLARDLSFGEQRFLSIARALVGDPSLVLMDEPTVGLDQNARAKLLDLMTRLAAQEGRALLVIEHNMDVVMSVSTKVVLLVQGQVVASGPPAEIRAHRRMAEAYLGTKHAAPG